MCRKPVALAAVIVALAAWGTVGLRLRAAGTLDLKADLAAVLDGIKRSEAEVTSLRGYFTFTDFLNEGFRLSGQRHGNTPPAGTDQSGVIAVLRKAALAFSGERWWAAEHEVVPVSASGVNYYAEAAYDGTTTTARETGATMNIVQPSRWSARPGPDPDRRPMAAGWAASLVNIPFPNCAQLSQRITHSGDAVLDGVEVVLDLPCYRINSNRGAEGRFMESWWVAPSRGYRLVRYLMQGDPVGRQGTRHGMDNLVLQWRDYGGVWLPVRFRSREWVVRRGKERSEFYKYLQADELSVNPTLPDSTFRVEPKLGDWVLGVASGDGPSVFGGSTSEIEEALKRRDYPPEVARDPTMLLKKP